MVAAFLACLTLTVGLYAVNASAAQFSRDYGNALRQESALTFSEKLLKKCFGEGGLARCGNGMVYSHEIDEALADFMAENTSTVIENEFGERILGVGEEKNYSACVTRIALFEGKEVVLQACTGGLE